MKDINKYNREWRLKNLEHTRTWYREYAKTEVSKAIKKRYYIKKRMKVLNHYGVTCSCCGEAEIKFLTLHHMKGGGNEHRKKVGEGMHMYDWIIKNNFPNDFSTLCFNCNCAIGHNGVCPHVERRH